MTASSDELVRHDPRTQAILEGRLVPEERTFEEPVYEHFGGRIPSRRLLTDPPKVRIPGYFPPPRQRTRAPDKYVPGVPHVVSEWNEVLKDPKMRKVDNKTLLDTQKRFFADVRARSLYKDKTDDEFRDHVIKPVLDATFEDPRFKPDFDIPVSTRVALAIDRALPGGAIDSASAAIVKMIEGIYPLELKDAKGRTLGGAVEEFKDQQSIMSDKEAIQTVRRELSKKESQMPLLSGKRMVEYTVPRVMRTVAEFAILKKLGVPVTSKALAAKAPGLSASLSTAQMLGAHTAVTDLYGWKDDPVEKAANVMKSAGLGAIVGPVRAYIKNPISRMGVITGGMAAQTYVSSRLLGADTEDSFRNAFQTIETLLALEISGYIQNKAQLAKAHKLARNTLIDSYMKEYPQMNRGDATLHADALVAGVKQEGIYRTSNRLIKPLLQLEQQGKLLPEEAKQLKMFRERSSKLFQGTQKVIAASEKFFVDRTVSRYPGKVTDQASLEDIGSKMAKDLGIDPSKIIWSAHTSGGLTTTKEVQQGAKRFGDIRFLDKAGVWGAQIAVDQSNVEIKKTILHELIHAFTPAMVTKDGKIVSHHKEFKRRLAEQEKRLVTKTRTEVSKAEKLASEQYRQRQRDASYIEKRVKSLGLSSDERAALVYEATGKVYKGSLLQPEITTNQIAKIRSSIDRFRSIENVNTMEAALGITAAESTRLKKSAGQKLDTYAQALGGRNNVPLDRDAYVRKQQLSILQSNAKAMSRRESGWGWFKDSEKLHFLNPRNWASSRYFFDYLSRVTGRPLLERKDYLEQSFKEGHMKWNDFGQNFIKSIGLSENQVLKMNDVEKANLANYLFYGRAVDFNQLSANGRRIAGSIQGALNEGGPVANQIRSLMWKKMNTMYSRQEVKRLKALARGDKKTIGGLNRQLMRVKPSDVKIEDIPRLIAEGRAAKSSGKFDDYIASQKWGTREYYYMGEHEWDDFKTDTLELLKTPSLDVYEKNLRQAKIDYGALKARKEGAKPDITTHPYLKTKRHAHRAYTLNAMYDNFEKFNNSIMGVEHLLKPQDKAAVEMYRNNILGRQGDIGAANRLFMRINEAWWDGYSKQPTRVLYFGYRNLFQNLGLLPSQISPVQFTKSALQLIKQGGPSKQAMVDYRTWYDSTINQKRQMWETMSMVEHPEALKLRGMARLLNIGREVIPLTDGINRQMLWWPLHQLATSNLESYRNGKITSKQLMNNLRLHTTATGQKDRLLNLLSQKADKEFVKWYTTDKVRNAHFVYDKFGRSVLELNPTNRSYIGLATWPRGAFEAYYHQAVKPIIVGTANKNYAQAYEGIKNLTGTVVGLYLAREGMKRSFGTKGAGFGQEPYGIVGAISYNPMTPGMGWVGESFGMGLGMLNDTYNMFAKSEEMRLQGKNPQTVFDSWLTQTSRQVEYFIPMVDVAKEYFDKANDKDGVRFYQILKSLVTDYDIRADRDIKNNYQGVVEKWTTGMFGTE
jgi:hypothetical protein